MSGDPGEAAPASRMEKISTHWSALGDPGHFLLRYAPAVRRYLQAILRDPADADDVLQELLLRVVERGWDRASPDRGRFRFYLRTAVRNAALSWLRRRRATAAAPAPEAVTPGPEAEAEREWSEAWRRCVLDRAWREIERHERAAPESLYHTVLRLAADAPGADSRELARLAAERAGRPVSPEAFRKQLSRARRRFAELLLQEVAEGLERPTADDVEGELAEVGLLEHVRPFLPDDWRATWPATS